MVVLKHRSTRCLGEADFILALAKYVFLNHFLLGSRKVCHASEWKEKKKYSTGILLDNPFRLELWPGKAKTEIF